MASASFQPVATIQTADSGHVLRRKCACGTHTVAGGECQGCKKDKLQRKSVNGAAPASAPASVHQVLGSAGAALPSSVRANFERGFGHDFSHVRVHDDSAAARSAADVDALAYTVGSHVVFGAGQFSPGSPGGRHLIAHELAHVVQQRGDTLQRKAQSELAIGSTDDAAEKEADAAADHVTGGGASATLSTMPQLLQRAPRPTQRSLPHTPPRHAPAIEGLDEAGPGADLTGRTESELWRCLKGTDGIPDACPQRPLAWSDFKADDSIGFPAQVLPLLKPKVMDPVAASCVERILGWSEGRTHVFQALLGGAQARKHTLGMLDDSQNGCGALLSQCQDFFAGGTPATPFSVRRSGGTRCPAAHTAVGLQAKSSDECTTLSTECHARQDLEQARLLRHEQGHIDIACALARAINASIAAGAPPCAFERTGPAKLNELTALYDTQTAHGCIAGKQAGWEAEIRAGLPKQPVRRGACPVPGGPRRRGGGPRRPAPGSRPGGTSMRL